MAEWGNGRLEEWRDGVVEKRNGRTVMTEWRNGEMAGLHDDVYV